MKKKPKLKRGRYRQRPGAICFNLYLMPEAKRKLYRLACAENLYMNHYLEQLLAKLPEPEAAHG